MNTNAIELSKLALGITLGIINGYFWANGQKEVSIIIISSIVFLNYLESGKKNEKKQNIFNDFEKEMKKFKLERRRKK